MPGRDVAPGPAGGLQRIGRGRQLPPVLEDQRGTGLDGRTVGLGEQGREPDAVGPLISVLAGEVGEVVLGVGGGVLRAGAAAGAVAAGSAAAVVGRIGDEGVDAAVGDGGDGGQRVTSVQGVRHCAVLSFRAVSVRVNEPGLEGAKEAFPGEQVAGD